MNRIFIFFFIGLLFVSKSVTAQQPVLENYMGTWQWSDGKGDTLTILLKKCKRGVNILRSEPDSIFTNLLLGFHSYIEKGQLVENNMNLVADTLSNYQSFGGRLLNGNLSIVFFDALRDREFKGTLTLLSEFPNKAILSLPYAGERIVWEKKKIYPNGRTIPDNIVLRKIE